MKGKEELYREGIRRFIVNFVLLNLFDYFRRAERRILKAMMMRIEPPNISA